jgi:hypothetical protein
MKKKCYLFLLSLLQLTASADSVELYGVWYNLNNVKRTAELTKSEGEAYSGDFEVQSDIYFAGIKYKVTCIGKSAFEGCHELSSVKIPSTVTVIDDGAFWECTGLSSITIPEGVMRIGDGAFGKCTNLESVTIPSTMTAIDANAFAQCSNLTTVTSRIREPFEIDISTFATFSAILTVPEGTEAVYRSTKEWKLFAIINEAMNNKRTIHVEKAGTLATLIPEEERYLIDELVLTGELNGTDIRLIRNLAGIDYDYSNGTTEERYKDIYTAGNLQTLDISGATIVEGGRDYYANSIGLHDEFYGTEDNALSAYMFSGCKLTSIIIPCSINSIGHFAFENCWNLTTIWSLNNEPPTCGSDAFYALDKETCLVLVPQGSREIYEESGGWKDFHQIREIIAGDVNLDGNVDKSDVDTLAAYILSENPQDFFDVFADLNGDGIINATDIVMLIDLIYPQGPK